jgi:transitional endoplasmic reticulum ATPase
VGPVETIECYGARIALAGPAEVLAEADGGPVLHADSHPAPLRGIELTVMPGGAPGARLLRGTVTLGGSRWGNPALARDVVETVVPLAAALLLGSLRAPLAAATVGAAGALRARQRQREEDARDDAEERPAALSTSVFGGELPLTHGTARGSQRTISTEVEIAEATAEDLIAFACVLLDVARLAAGRPDDDAFFAGRTYTLGTPPRTEVAVVPVAPDVPQGLDALGGLQDVVAQLREVATSFRHPEVMRRWGARRPRGILLYGPPGTGKTTLARALAAEVGAGVREIRVPDVLNMWVGSSERNLKKVFTDARRVTVPTLLLFDEFESIISYTGQARDAASQMNNALAGLFKQEMGTLVDENPNVLVVATTNFPERVDESLIRAGRFDLHMEVPLPDAPARADIFRKILRTQVEAHETPGFRLLDEDIDVDALADATEDMSGADVDEILRRIQMSKALTEARGEPVTPISQADLLDAITRMRVQHGYE